MKIYKLKHYGTAPIPPSNTLTQDLKNPYSRKHLTPSRDFCTGKYGSKHRFEDYTYWNCEHPKCDFCGYEDETRTL